MEVAKMKSVSLVCLSLLLAVACGSQPATAVWQSELPVDTLTAVLSLGTEMGDSTSTFGLIQDAVILEDGGILVLDGQAACIKVFDPSGNYVRQVARRGSGPGELNIPWEFFQMPDGRLMVLEMLKQGFVVFDDSLRFQQEISHWTQNPPMQSTALSNSTFAAFKIDADMVDEQIVMHRRVAIYTVGEKEYDMVLWGDSLTATMNQIIENPSMFITDLLDALCIAGDGAGSVFFAMKDGEKYQVTGWNASGEEILRISMNLAPVPKTPEEIQEESEYMTRFMNSMGSGMPFTFEPEPYRNMVVNLGVGPDGNLWVQRGTTDTPFFDIFDLDGNPVRHAAFNEPGWSWTFAISPRGILAWEMDPAEGYQRLYLLE
jgi:hypothetical protein